MKSFEIISFDAYNTLFDLRESMEVVASQIKSDADANWQQNFWPRLASSISTYFSEVALVHSFAKTSFLYHYALKRSGLLQEITCSVDDAISLIKQGHIQGKLIDGMAELIDRLKKNYRMVAVLSDSDTDMLKETLRRNNLTFDVMLTSEMARGYKPNKENVFQLFKDIIGIKSSLVLHVGDSSFDVVSSTKAGFKACLFDPLQHCLATTHLPPHHVARDLTDLLELTNA